MAQIVSFKNNRLDYEFRVFYCNGRDSRYPVIALYHIETGLIAGCPEYEPFYLQLNEKTYGYVTLKNRAYSITAFLNFVLHHTLADNLSEVTVDILRGFLLHYKTKEGETERKPDSWRRGVENVYDFICTYIKSCGITCEINPDDLYKYKVINGKKGRKLVVKEMNYLGVKAPRSNTRKNRLLVESHLPLLLYEARKWDPMLTLAIAAGAYGGLREGETMNLTRRAVTTEYAGFGRIGKVKIDLTKPAPHVETHSGKISCGKIKRFRVQEIYPDFIADFRKIYAAHEELLNARGLPSGNDVPVFYNDYGNAMTVDTYRGRLKKLFTEHFLTDLKLLCQHDNTYIENAGYIEAYENDYPGAHMLRHWYTMYLITHTTLTKEEIAKWRGDRSSESMEDYIHLNREIIDAFRSAAFRFQESVLEEIL